MSAKLNIIAAAYGLNDVTQTVTGLVNKTTSPQSLTIQASNSVLGDGWPGVQKSLTVVYRYGVNGSIQTVAVKENETLTINSSIQEIDSPASVANLTILGATYGPKPVTKDVIPYINQTTLSLTLTTTNATFGETWQNVRKSFVIVAAYENQDPFMDIVPEDETYSLKFPPPLQVISASWGLEDVSSTLAGMINRRAINVTANNATFGDGWVGVKKTLTVVYQYADQQPLVAIAIEGSNLVVNYNPSIPGYQPPTPPDALTIIGASYGPIDVTAVVKKLVTNKKLKFTADNKTFTDTWPKVQKSFSLTYSKGTQKESLICKENELVNIA